VDLPRLYAIADDSGSTPLVEQVGLMLIGGARLIQLRAKQTSARELYDATLAALELARPFDARIIVNDRIDVALACGAHGVHLGQNDLPVQAARRLLGEGAILGLSTHSSLQAAEPGPVDYVAIGPVFATKSKERPDPVVGVAGVAAARAVCRRPLVAIGGITLETSLRVIEAGADAVAVIGDLRVGGMDARVSAFVELLETGS
jgi:thiamine-phosphate pyrophosphorylase